MRASITKTAIASMTMLGLLGACASMGGDKGGLSFFVTSAGPGNGANLGGLAGADAHCQKLATAAGAGHRSWRAYLSAQPVPGSAGVNARDRIGKGPWRNAKGEVVATDVENLHSGTNNLNKLTSITETGAGINGAGDTPNQHDILTGSQPNGTFIAGDVNSTCANWASGDAGAAMVGHHDRKGLDDSAPAKSWNSSHLTKGCSADALKSTGGAGAYYCFAAD
ncbi:MAG: hypothetical protein KA185_18810 [Vitreoscilla sp.]|nr:hypothetical protein [Vitreoscilla sp.]